MDCINQEVFKKQRRLHISLAKEIDYKNGKLLELECKIKEKDILLKEVLEERQSWKLQLEKLKNKMDHQEQQLGHSGNKEFNHFTQSRNVEFKNMVCLLEPQKMNLDQSVDTMSNKDHELMQLKVHLKELENENADMKDEHQTLITKERMTNDELQDARKEAIRAWQGLSAHHLRKFQIKRMGQIDRKPFEAICTKKCSSGGDWQAECAKLCSHWEERVKNPHWHPFKRVENHGRLIEIIDEDDEQLKELRSESGEDVYKAVTNALMELNEYNPSGKYPVPELWDSRKGRKASLKEIIEYTIKKLKALQTKRKRSL
ncbi:hypothetical protein ACH5RR_019259 [Cinchona calisaya]|uniref:Factor of DNA methylation 1-5/IDN2 domain-containing protein n=1 Tax=Cinchona calisaya TaxID=153742 RepID=A0ABD2ZRZ2_9GENT